MQIKDVAKSLGRFDKSGIIEKQYRQLEIDRLKNPPTYLESDDTYVEFFYSACLIGSEVSAQFSFDESGELTELTLLGTQHYIFPTAIPDNKKVPFSNGNRELQRSEFLDILSGTAEKYGIGYTPVNPKLNNPKHTSPWDFYVFCSAQNVECVGLSSEMEKIAKAQRSLIKMLNSKIAPKAIEARIQEAEETKKRRDEKQRTLKETNTDTRTKMLLHEKYLKRGKKSSLKSSSYDFPVKNVRVNGEAREFTPRGYIEYLAVTNLKWPEITAKLNELFDLSKNEDAVRQMYYVWNRRKGKPASRPITVTKKSKERAIVAGITG